MRNLVVGGVCLTLLVALTGCGGITGNWRLHEVTPASAEQNFEFGKLELRDDNTYAAEAVYEGQTRQMSGTYTYDEQQDRITFSGEQGMTRTYGLKPTGMGKLQVWGVEPGEDWTATMKRGK